MCAVTAILKDGGSKEKSLQMKKYFNYIFCSEMIESEDLNQVMMVWGLTLGHIVILTVLFPPMINNERLVQHCRSSILF